MSNLFKKALGVFVDFDEEQKKDGARAGDAGADPAGSGALEDAAGAGADGPDAILADAPADLSQDPDVARVMQAGKLLASLPLTDIPVETARELVGRTLEFAGIKTAELLASFGRASDLYKAAVQLEQAKIADRQKQHQERMQLLEAAVAEEKKQFQTELAARKVRIATAGDGLTGIEQAMAFFAPEDEQIT